MSMMGRFVQVSPDRLRQIIDDPSGVEELFVSDQAAKAMPKFMGAMKGLEGRAPKMLAASMARERSAMTSAMDPHGTSTSPKLPRLPPS